MQGMQQQQPNSSVPAAITESRDVMIFLTPNWPQQCSPLSTVFDLIKVTDEEHHGLRGPIVAIDRFVDTYMSLFFEYIHVNLISTNFAKDIIIVFISDMAEHRPHLFVV